MLLDTAYIYLQYIKYNTKSFFILIVYSALDPGKRELKTMCDWYY